MNTKGYILLDTLSALSIVLFVALLLLPMFMKLQEDRKEIELELQAQHLLYEKLQQYTVQASSTPIIAQQSQENRFHYTFQPFEINVLYMKGCVSYETSRNSKVSFCDVVKAK